MGMRGDRFNRFRCAQDWEKIEFPTLDHFIDEVKDSSVETVRVDVFSQHRASELSFVYYVTTTLFVTALCKRDAVIYEYTEWLSTAASDGKRRDASLTEPAQARLNCVRSQLRAASFSVRQGRYGQPDDRPS